MVDNKDYHKRAWIEVCGRHGLVITEEKYFSLIHARTNDVILQNIFGPGLTTAKRDIGVEKEATYRNLYRTHVTPISGLLDFLKELKAGAIPCAIASNSPVENVNLVIDELKIRDFFSAVISADDVKHGKPDPEIFSDPPTLIRLLLGDIEPKVGSVWLNPDVRTGYLSQMLGELDPSRSTADNVRDRTGLLPVEARNLLGRMGITGDTQLQALGTLSMGERTRVAVSCLCFGRYDALVLDEPTNHLDANARDCVEEALVSFPGALLVATHDRFFLDRVCNMIWSLESGRVRVAQGGYTQFKQEGTRTETPAEADDAMRELGLQTDMAYLVSRISASRDAADKADLERQYTAALEKLKALRGTMAKNR
jgi:ATPase subunit of ABC transporter with duplicated ATPase domains